MKATSDFPLLLRISGAHFMWTSKKSAKNWDLKGFMWSISWSIVSALPEVSSVRNSDHNSNIPWQSLHGELRHRRWNTSSCLDSNHIKTHSRHIQWLVQVHCMCFQGSIAWGSKYSCHREESEQRSWKQGKNFQCTCMKWILENVIAMMISSETGKWLLTHRCLSGGEWT